MDSPAGRGGRNKKDEKILCLRTNAHFNNGHKFYKFENILEGTCNQATTFQQCNIAQMARCFVRQGKNCNVLVYGPTNSGKTYTMIGDCPSLQGARMAYSRSPRPKKGHSAFTDKKKRSKSNQRAHAVSCFTGDLEKQSDGRSRAGSLLKRTRSQNNNKDFEEVSRDSNYQTASPYSALKSIADANTGGIIPRALK